MLSTWESHLKQVFKFLKLILLLSVVGITTWFVTRNRLETTIDFWPLANPLVKPVYYVFLLGMLTGVVISISVLGYNLIALYASNQKLKRDIKKLQAELPLVNIRPEPSADLRLSPDL